MSRTDDIAPVELLIDRFESLIRDDDRLTVVETIGALNMIAIRIATATLEDDS